MAFFLCLSTVVDVILFSGLTGKDPHSQVPPSDVPACGQDELVLTGLG